jgi:hypothetical protein
MPVRSHSGALGVHDASITGQNNTTLAEVFTTASYSTSSEKIPNLYLYMGPSCVPSAESTLHMIEFSCAYMILCIQKFQREHLKSIVFSARACRAWMRQVDRYFGKTTFTYTCKSWAKANVSDGRVMAIWPGSSMHARVAFQSPRWESYEVEYLDEGWGEDGKEDFFFF